jgi:hypothetical protein
MGLQLVCARIGNIGLRLSHCRVQKCHGAPVLAHRRPSVHPGLSWGVALSEVGVEGLEAQYHRMRQHGTIEPIGAEYGRQKQRRTVRMGLPTTRCQ